MDAIDRARLLAVVYPFVVTAEPGRIKHLCGRHCRRITRQCVATRAGYGRHAERFMTPLLSDVGMELWIKLGGTVAAKPVLHAHA